LVPQRFREEIGVATGVVGAAGGLGGFLIPSWLGVVKDMTGSYGVGFVCFGLAGFGCLALLRLVQRGWHLSWLSRTVEALRVPPQMAWSDVREKC
jgi:NNP family nitrate/nitrite transporter-like MFS transporter